MVGQSITRWEIQLKSGGVWEMPCSHRMRKISRHHTLTNKMALECLGISKGSAFFQLSDHSPIKANKPQSFLCDQQSLIYNSPCLSVLCLTPIDTVGILWSW